MRAPRSVYLHTVGIFWSFALTANTKAITWKTDKATCIMSCQHTSWLFMISVAHTQTHTHTSDLPCNNQHTTQLCYQLLYDSFKTLRRHVGCEFAERCWASQHFQSHLSYIWKEGIWWEAVFLSFCLSESLFIPIPRTQGSDPGDTDMNMLNITQFSLEFLWKQPNQREVQDYLDEF